MKQKLSITLVLVVFVGLLNSCKESPNNPALNESKVEFVFSSSLVKSASEQGLTNIVITVEDLQGNTILNSEKIDIYHMNGQYISEPLEMVVGDYKLTRFLVLNGENDVVYATPKEGSDNAHLVENPLPVNFSANDDSISEVTPEVVAVGDSDPKDFGYVSFSFDIADSFKILMGAAVLDSSSQNYKLTTAHVEIFSEETSVYEGELNPYPSNVDTLNYDSLNLVNEIILPEGFDEFTVIVSKWGYKDYNKTFPKEELRLYYSEENKGPLVVILEKGIGDTCNVNAGIDQVILSDTTSLFASDPYPAVGTWSLISGSGVFVDLNNPGTRVTGIGIGTNVFRWTVECNGQTSYDDVSISYTSLSANAGMDQVLCSDTTQLNAADSISGTGVWSIIEGSGKFIDVNDPKTQVTGLGVGTNIFRWTTSYNGSVDSDEVNITYSPITAYAGLDQVILSDVTSLYASNPDPAVGIWSVVSGNGIFADASDPETQVTGLGAGTNIFRWTVTNGNCIDSDDVTIINNQ